MPNHARSIAATLTAAALVCFAGSAAAQDSVASTPGGNDALSAYTDHQVRYVVDLTLVNSSWGNQFGIAPIAKANEDPTTAFETMLIGSASISPNVLTGGPNTEAYQSWSTAGAGVNTTENTASTPITPAAFDRSFAFAFTEITDSATNAIGATVSYEPNNLNRLFVERTVAAVSRASVGSTDNATLSIGGVNASGQVSLRADDFTATGGGNISGENIAIVDVNARNTGATNLFISFVPGTTTTTDGGATTFIVNSETVTQNVPSIGASGEVVGLDFANRYRSTTQLPGNAHLATGIDAHRGNPSFADIDDLGGVGLLGAIAKAQPGGPTDSINLAAVDGTGAPVATFAATLPAGLSVGAGNTTDAEFLQYLSQEGFRGPMQVGLGLDPANNAVLAAATATDSAVGEFIAVASFPIAGGSATWNTVAFAGQDVLDGPSGNPIATLVGGSPAALSGPAIDLLGNVYFVGQFTPVGGGSAKNGLFKAVNNAGGYEIELLIAEEDTFVGANSQSTYVIDRLTLADGDSVAPGGFHGQHVLHPQPSAAVDPADPHAFGGVIVNAQIRYDRVTNDEPYDTVLFVGPTSVSTPCPGDTNADGVRDFADLTTLLSNFNLPGGGTEGDTNADGLVDFADLTTLLSVFNLPCP